MKQRSKLIKFLTRIVRLWRKLNKSNQSYTPAYRVANIEKNTEGEYEITVQLIGKNVIHKVAPEKLLADDKMVNCFSPTDIRTLTYLGYLEMHSPKYKILAKRLSENTDQTLFAIQKKGERKHRVVTANDISKDEEIIRHLSQKDAHMVGITTATEQHALEKKQKEKILKQLKKNQP
ncbi:MAG: hypothetical protein COV52_04430 [Gammaproteobacteria bacterium CG11_big_fil_rev_8_21_14_0_20_46_22]|nr:MAG: hypothetical protein COV52_04430 [Gammaproteobacteria bacterium CG11_big_fil_rev_8_21_14_0_20_46_22]